MLKFQDIYLWYEFENYQLKITATSPRSQWLNRKGILPNLFATTGFPKLVRQYPYNKQSCFITSRINYNRILPSSSNHSIATANRRSYFEHSQERKKIYTLKCCPYEQEMGCPSWGFEEKIDSVLWLCNIHICSWAEEWGNSIANALELPQSCAKPLICQVLCIPLNTLRSWVCYQW